jgi:hypothetical protein
MKIDMRIYKHTSALTNAMVLAVACAGLLGCHLPKPKFDSSFNPERKKIGLEVLPADWQPISIGSYFTTWRVPVITGQPQLTKITATYERDRLILEEDNYSSGKTFNSFDGTLFEELCVRYYLVKKIEGLDSVKGWYCLYSGRFSARDIKDTSKPVDNILSHISLEQADSILKNWGLTPPLR